LAVLVALGEYARGHVLTGLPWNLPLMGWAGWLYLAQPVALIGIYGLSLLALLSAALISAGLQATDKPSAILQRSTILAGLGLPVAAFLYSAFTLHMGARPIDTGC
jgi:apolipoprotein N-acyltransferase